MQVNIITLPHRKDRHEHLEKELNRQGITDYHLWKGIQSSSPRQSIADSHKMIVEYAREKGLHEVCIAEDDFYFPSDKGFNHFMKNKPYGFDIYLSGIYTGSNRITKENKQINYHFSGLHFYIIHSKFYNTFLNRDVKFQDIDNSISELAVRMKANIQCCFPFAAIQTESISDNSRCIFNHKYFFNEANTFGYRTNER